MAAPHRSLALRCAGVASGTPGRTGTRAPRASEALAIGRPRAATTAGGPQDVHRIGQAHPPCARCRCGQGALPDPLRAAVIEEIADQWVVLAAGQIALALHLADDRYTADGIAGIRRATLAGRLRHSAGVCHHLRSRRPSRTCAAPASRWVNSSVTPALRTRCTTAATRRETSSR